jgi:hypothetical protein
MYSHRHSAESRPFISITSAITRGESWTARFIPHNNLRQHCHVIARTFRASHPITDPIREPCARLLKSVEENSSLFTVVHPSAFPVVPVLVRIAAYSKNWIRDPESWVGIGSSNPREILHHLLRHLFARWEIPAFFDNAWLVRGDLVFLERDWYCHLAQGFSLRKVPGMPPSITSRALHLSMDAPHYLTIRQALRWGQVKALGSSSEFLEEVLTSRMVTDLSNDAIWSRLLEKCTAAKHFNPRHFGLIADTLLEVMGKEDAKRAEVLVELPLKELLSYSLRYWKTLLRLIRVEQPDVSRNDIACPNFRYELHHIAATQWARLPRTKPFDFIYQDNAYRIVELTNQWQLVAESRAMRHCVDSYGKTCKLGRCSIFSVRTDEIVHGKIVPTSHLTIEVDRRSRRIVEVRGRRNQYVFAQRIQLLRKWAEEMELTF